MRNIERAIFMNMCMITDGKGNVVLQERPGPGWPGVAFPGGHVEAGENFTESTIREIKEETGLTIRNLRLCGVKDWIRVEDGVRCVGFLYRTEDFEGELTSSEEGRVFWARFDEIGTFALANGMETIVKLMTDEGIWEQFFVYDEGIVGEKIL